MREKGRSIVFHFNYNYIFIWQLNLKENPKKPIALGG